MHDNEKMLARATALQGDVVSINDEVKSKEEELAVQNCVQHACIHSRRWQLISMKRAEYVFTKPRRIFGKWQMDLP